MIVNKETEQLSYTEYFRKMYQAHDIIADIRERIDKLYLSATRVSPVSDGMPKSTSNPKRFEETIVEMADLRTRGENLLRQRAKFDLFVCDLTVTEAKVLSMRCEKGMGWKEIAGELRISISSAKGIWGKVESKADDFGCFCPISTENT